MNEMNYHQMVTNSIQKEVLEKINYHEINCRIKQQCIPKMVEMEYHQINDRIKQNAFQKRMK